MVRRGDDSLVRAFAQLTGREPFPWQVALYERFTALDDSGRVDIPSVASIPTGLGKTSVIAIWLIALANGAPLPRRLVYVVNRRTVVDQTTGEAESLKERVQGGALPGIEELAISTLRGQYADNGEWYADPSRPAIICGTVDMIGSRLLFGGYRIGFKSRPLHAGFLGQDALLVHDEAHLEPAFQQLVTSIQREQEREQTRGGASVRSGLRVMALSATARGSDVGASFRLSDAERHPPREIPRPPEAPIHHVWARLTAFKSMRLYLIEDEKKSLVSAVVERALEHRASGDAVVVFLRSVKKVEEAAKLLTKYLKKDGLPGHVVTLTGTMRGLERDRLVNEPSFRRFLPDADTSDEASAAGAVYLICTSAGEVGVNLSADHAICDLSTFDSMAQRLGRVNRFGLREDTRVDVVHPEFVDGKGSAEPEEVERRRRKTLDLLRQLPACGCGGLDASPRALEELDAKSREDAFAPEPSIPPATDVLFDAWSMTSVRGPMPGRPPLAPYLHGVAEWEPSRTSVAWRREVELLDESLLERYGDSPQTILEDYALKPHELLNDRSDRILEGLSAIHARLSKLDKRCAYWLIDPQGGVSIEDLGKLVSKDRKRATADIAEKTVLLPPSVGGLRAGLFDGTSPDSADVADEWFDEKSRHRRIRLWDEDEPRERMALIRTIDTNPDPEESQSSEASDDSEGAVESAQGKRRLWRWYAQPRDAENPTPASLVPVRLDDHSRDVANEARRMVDALGLPTALQKAVVLAAEMHDVGKRREIWQRSIGNPRPTDWYAKPGKPIGEKRWRPRRISEYRHEFGSLLDFLDEGQPHCEKLERFDTETRDLIIHLIAAHHGRARPHFTTEETVDPNHSQSISDEVALEAMRRFARLQRRFGRWGLAYLESLVRAADWAASANPSSMTEQEDGQP